MKLQYILIVLMLAFGACKSSLEKKTATTTTANTSKQTVIKRVDNTTFAKAIKTLSNEQIVDVRTPGEFSKGAIENAVNMNYHDRDFAEQAVGKLDKNKPVMLYCAGGVRSAKAAKILKKQGFKEIYDLESGYTGWE